MSDGTPEQNLKQIFKIFDLNNDGKINLEEMKITGRILLKRTMRMRMMQIRLKKDGKKLLRMQEDILILCLKILPLAPQIILKIMMDLTPNTFKNFLEYGRPHILGKREMYYLVHYETKNIYIILKSMMLFIKIISFL